MKKLNKIVFILVLILSSYAMIYSVDATKHSSDIWNSGKEFLETGADTTGMTEEGIGILNKLGIDTKSNFAELIDFIWGIGLLVIFISTVVLGIKYMLVLPDEKSRLKQATFPYIIGVVIIFGALTIWKFVIFILDGSL